MVIAYQAKGMIVWICTVWKKKKIGQKSIYSVYNATRKMFRASNLNTLQAIPCFILIFKFRIVKLLQSDAAGQQVEAHPSNNLQTIFDSYGRQPTKLKKKALISTNNNYSHQWWLDLRNLSKVRSLRIDAKRWFYLSAAVSNQGLKLWKLMAVRCIAVHI